MRVMTTDGVELTNNKDVTVTLFLGYSAEWKAIISMCCLMMSENDEALLFAVLRALAWFFGKILERIRSFGNDDCDSLSNGAEAAKEAELCPEMEQFLCFWHGVYKRMDMITAGWDKTARVTAIGVTSQLSYIEKHANSLEEVQAGIRCVVRYIEARCAAGFITGQQAQAIIRGSPDGLPNGVIGYVTARLPLFFPGARPRGKCKPTEALRKVPCAPVCPTHVFHTQCCHIWALCFRRK